MIKIFKYLLCWGVLVVNTLGQKKDSPEGQVTYLKEVKVDLKIKNFINLVEITWGKVIEDKDKVSRRWQKLIEIAWFPVTNEKISYDEWILFYDVDSFPREGFGKDIYNKTIKKYPNAELFKSSEINKFRANQIIFAEVLINKNHCLLLGQYKKDYAKSPQKLNVFGKIFSINEKGNLLHSYKRPVILEDAVFPATNINFLEKWITEKFAIRSEGGKLILLNLDENSLLRNDMSSRAK